MLYMYKFNDSICKDAPLMHKRAIYRFCFHMCVKANIYEVVVHTDSEWIISVYFVCMLVCDGIRMPKYKQIHCCILLNWYFLKSHTYVLLVIFIAYCSGKLIVLPTGWCTVGVNFLEYMQGYDLKILEPNCIKFYSKYFSAKGITYMIKGIGSDIGASYCHCLLLSQK